MKVEKGDHGLFFTMSIEVAAGIGLVEGDDVSVRATSERTMEVVRAREGHSPEVVAILEVQRRDREAAAR